MRKFCFVACLVLSLFQNSGANEPDLLKAKDVERIMHQILSQHLGNKEVTNAIIQHAVEIFINQFDPQRRYLLQSEVIPYASLSQQQLAELVEQYKKNDFAYFEKMNELFQKAIIRARKIRASVEEKNKDKLFTNGALEFLKFDPDSLNYFPKGEEELEQRILIYLTDYIEGQKKRYGASETTQQKDAILQNYENRQHVFENQYLYQNDPGEPLPAAEKENLFNIHVLKALASSLDAHTSFYQASEAYDMRVRLQKEFQGIGIGLRNTSEGIVVTRLIEGGPAARSGVIQPSDILTKVDGQPMSGMDFEKVINQLHGEKGTHVTLSFKRPAHEKEAAKDYEVTLKREEITVNTDRVDYGFVPFGDGIIGKITLHSFYQGDGVSSEMDVIKAINDLKKKGNLKGLILDLRENMGGFLSQAVKVAGLFISNGVVVISKYSNGEKHYYRDVESHEAYEGPLVILTSKTTASAAEIVAQALQDYGVALVVGDEKTYGKGTIQTQTVTDNQSSSYFKVTVGKYYTVSGKTPQRQGVKADIVVPSRWHNIQIGEEDEIPSDTIAPSYNDTLEDVSASEKPFYLKYYMPTIQHRIEEWVKMLPTLRENSAYRLAHNKNFQFFLKGTPPKTDELPSEEEESEWVDGVRPKSYGVNDMQMNEAVRIVEDMVMLSHVENNDKK